MARTSAGILAFRRCDGTGATGGVEVLLAHPGGPFWAKKDLGAWSIPKGEFEPDESPRDAAAREFCEELGCASAPEIAADLGTVRQSGGKVVHGFAAEFDIDPASVVSNTIEIAWPPKSGRTMVVPEIDRVEWFDLAEARRRINAAQAALVDRLEAWLADAPSNPSPDRSSRD